MSSISIVLFILAIVIGGVLSRNHHHHHHHRRHHQHMHPLSDEFINYINSQQSLWTAGRNFHRNTPWSYIKSLAGTIITDSENSNIITGEQSTCNEYTKDDKFDARTYWGNCNSIKKIRDQGGCGSCWAVAVASVMSDRVCTFTKGAETFTFSAEDILTCCRDCLTMKNDLCAGGFTHRAWAFASREGVVSGGDWRGSGGCKHYSFEQCNHTTFNGIKDQCTTHTNLIQNCSKTCTSNPKLIYKHDIRMFGASLKIRDVNQAMCEIKSNGPIVAVMNVYYDFLSYKHGTVYRHIESGHNKVLGNHSVKILGWGRQDGVDFWLAANSWNSQWGENGFFKIVRGQNECGIEDNMSAATLK